MREGVRARESPRESLTPSPDRLLLLFWAHYIQDDLHLLCTVLLYVITFYRQKGKNVANYFKQKDVTDQGGKWLNWLHSILGWFSTDFRKLKTLSKHLLPQSRVRDF